MGLQHTDIIKGHTALLRIIYFTKIIMTRTQADLHPIYSEYLVKLYEIC